MKKILSIVLTTLILVASLATAPISATADPISYSEKEVEAYLFSMDDTATFTCLFRDDIPDLLYIDAVDYLNQLYNVEFTEEETADGIITVSNKNGSFIVDAEQDVVHFDCFEEIAYPDAKEPVKNMQSKFIEHNNNYRIVGEKKSYDFDLGKYEIDVVAKDGKAYFPLVTICDMFSFTYFNAQYLDGKIYFTKPMEEEQYLDTAKYFDTDKKRDNNLAVFTYNELCFVMDNFFGLPPRCKLSESIREKGFDRTLEEYDETTASLKTMLNTDDYSDFWFGLLLLDGYLFDGSHTNLSYGLAKALEKAPECKMSVEIKNRLDDKDNMLMVMNLLEPSIENAASRDALIKQQKTDLAKYHVVKKWDKALYIQEGDTGYFCFDEFADDAVDQLKWSLDYAKENGAKNFVIDLSTNGGGSTSVVMYIMAILTHQSSYGMKLRNQITGNLLIDESRIDINLDGKFDEKDDETEYDFRFAILTTANSYSSANLLPCLAQDAGIPILGENTGGGTCMIAIRNYPAFGNYSVSDQVALIHEDGTDVDSGAAPNFMMAIPGLAEMGISADYSNLYHIDEISKNINDYYANPSAYPPIAPATPDEIAPLINIGTDSNNSHQTISILLIVGLAVLALIIIAVIICIVIVKKRKKAAVVPSSSAAPDPTDNQKVE